MYDPHEQEPSQGQVTLLQTTLVGNISASQTLTVLTVAKVKGCIYALTSVGDIPVAAVNSSVCVNCMSYQ